jgi:hypothetical protein
MYVYNKLLHWLRANCVVQRNTIRIMHINMHRGGFYCHTWPSEHFSLYHREVHFVQPYICTGSCQAWCPFLVSCAREEQRKYASAHEWKDPKVKQDEIHCFMILRWIIQYFVDNIFALWMLLYVDNVLLHWLRASLSKPPARDKEGPENYLFIVWYKATHYKTCAYMHWEAFLESNMTKCALLTLS